nr:PREDICTED: DNA primase large subunit-like [Bemisia tabaci]
MNFLKTRRSKKAQVLVQYPCDLQLYKTPPTEEISLTDFDKYAINRLKVLRAMEQLTLKRTASTNDELKTALVAELKKQGLNGYAKLIQGNLGDSEDDILMRREDIASHFILRLVYCRTEDLRRWLLLRELDLFKLRWHCLAPAKRKQFLELNNLDYSVISDEDRNEAIMKSKGLVKHNTDYYKVHWSEVCDLVRSRKVFLMDGFAFITSSEIISVLTSHFRSHLAHCLSIAARKIDNIDDDTRLHPTLHNLHNAYAGESYAKTTSTDQISLESLEALSRKSFPLCMQQLHRTLRSEHHLRHGARQQYSLFLKGIGLSLEDAMTFWRSEFTKKMDVDKFDKNYAYNIRHNYGQEGKRTNYTPYSCNKIIMSSVGAGDQHGCPFRHNDQASLKSLLQTNGVSSADISEMMELVSKNNYQMACTKYFELKHGRELLDAIRHPNQYFSESVKTPAGNVAIAQTTANQKGAKGENKDPNKMDTGDDLWDESGFDFEALDAKVEASNGKV